MLQKDLFNPMTKTRVIEDEEFEKYLDIIARQEGETDSRLIETLKKIFMESHADSVAKDTLQKIWQNFEGPLKKNAGLANFTLDYGGCRSDHFFPWLASVQRSPSEALEMAYGYGRNLKGEFEYAKDDPWYMDAARNLPTLAFHRERQLTVANLITMTKGATMHIDKIKVVDLGAGWMDWARMHGFKLNPSVMEIIAFDKDPTIKPEYLFPLGLKESGVTYRKADISSALHEEICVGADAMIMQGVASYYPVEILANILARAYQLLRRNGVFFFDLQLDCIYYRWSVMTFDWPEMKLAKSASEAIDLIDGLRKKLWQKGFRFGAEYALDTYNETPAAVMVTLTKI